MARKQNRLDFGSVRKLPSGRYQARYPDPRGKPMTAPGTFATKAEALDHLAEVRADRLRGVYRDHRDGAEHFDVFARGWIDNGGRRGHLAERTKELYEDLLARDLAHFHGMPVSAITPREVRAWHAKHGRETAQRSTSKRAPGSARLRQAYALLRGILATAVEDRMIAENPCRIVGAGVAKAEERPYLSPETLARIVDAMPAWYHAPLRVKFGAHLRLGELLALQRGDFDAEHGTLRVERQAVTVGGAVKITPTKTGESRTITLPPSTAAILRDHLAAPTRFHDDDAQPAGAGRFPKSPMFVGRNGNPFTRGSLQNAWRKAAKKVGAPQFHVHDVRHAGLTLAAQSGATTRELMARAGHRTAAASMIYQHVAAERADQLAHRMDALAGATFDSPNGTRLARNTITADGANAIEADENQH
ncbi:tyrosine-type recombinase/integrase [Microbacterium karelineae]|uniref:tyrosine-type recombinase/integrase n=1 Tax=Microbacterium karelineae TaxID=2654283 RepID=UPI0018D3D219|nr:site-specific integrase [Microbacterium karelineae]